MSIIRCDLSSDEYLVWKHPQCNPEFGSQVIVNESQQAALFASGNLISLLQPGPHTLETTELPILKNFVQDGSKSFPFEVWFVNKVASTNFNWGTRTPIQIKEKSYGLIVPLSSYGNYECKINDIQSFIMQVVGVRNNYAISALREFLFPLVERETKDALANLAITEDVFMLTSRL